MKSSTLTSSQVILLLAVALSCQAAVSDLFLTHGERQIKTAGRKNDTWYSTNKGSIKIKLDGLGIGTNETRVYLKGSIENLSDDKIESVVLDLIIINPENKMQALRERILIKAPVFRSETLLLQPLTKDLSTLSEIVKCYNRIKGADWSYEVVTAIGQKVADSSDSSYWVQEYYKVRSSWHPPN